MGAFCNTFRWAGGDNFGLAVLVTITINHAHQHGGTFGPLGSSDFPAPNWNFSGTICYRASDTRKWFCLCDDFRLLSKCVGGKSVLFLFAFVIAFSQGNNNSRSKNNESPTVDGVRYIFQLWMAKK